MRKTRKTFAQTAKIRAQKTRKTNRARENAEIASLKAISKRGKPAEIARSVILDRGLAYRSKSLAILAEISTSKRSSKKMSPG